MDPQLALLLASAIPGVSGAGGFPPAPVTGSAIGPGPLVDSRLAAMAPKQPALPAAAPPATQPGTAQGSDEQQVAADQPATTVSGVDVVAPNPHPKSSAPINYDNSAAVSGAQSAIGAANAAARGAPAGPAQGGSDNPGVFGMLPPSMQHGTLRNVIGAIGDAFLVAGNKQPEYEQRMQRQEIGNAMAGVDPTDPASMTAAATRIAGTGAPGADQMAAQLVEKAQQARLATLLQQQNFQYKQGMLQDKDAQVKYQQQAVADRYAPQIGGMLTTVKTAADYAAVHDRLVPMAQQIGGPSATPESLWGLPSKDSWTPGITSGYGMTSNNQQVSSDKSAQRQVSMRDTDVNAGARVQAAGISAARPGPQPSPTGLLEQIMSIPAGQRTQEQQAYVTKALTPSRGAGRRAIPPAAGGAPAGGGTPQIPVNPQTGQPFRPFSAQDAAKLPKGTRFYGKDGNLYVR